MCRLQIWAHHIAILMMDNHATRITESDATYKIINIFAQQAIKLIFNLLLIALQMMDYHVIMIKEKFVILQVNLILTGAIL